MGVGKKKISTMFSCNHFPIQALILIVMKEMNTFSTKNPCLPNKYCSNLE